MPWVVMRVPVVRGLLSLMNALNCKPPHGRAPAIEVLRIGEEGIEVLNRPVAKRPGGGV